MNYVFYFFGITLCISGVGIIADTTSDIYILIGGIMLVMGGLSYMLEDIQMQTNEKKLTHKNIGTYIKAYGIC